MMSPTVGLNGGSFLNRWSSCEHLSTPGVSWGPFHVTPRDENSPKTTTRDGGRDGQAATPRHGEHAQQGDVGLPSSCGRPPGFGVGLAPLSCSQAAGVCVWGWLICPGKEVLGFSKNSAPRSGPSSAEGDFVWDKWLPWGLVASRGSPGKWTPHSWVPLQPRGCEAGRGGMQEPGKWAPLPPGQWPEGREALTLKCQPAPAPSHSCQLQSQLCTVPPPPRLLCADLTRSPGVPSPGATDFSIGSGSLPRNGQG